MLQHKIKKPIRQPLYLALLIAFASTAAAQEAATEETAPVAEEVNEAEKAGTEAAAEKKSMVLDSIKVTAQSREQELKDVPISVSVLDATMIDNLKATNLSDLDSFVPGLEVSTTSPTQPRYAIRGIGTSDFGVGTDSAVGVYIDGIYAARSGGAMLAFNDVERIEVLKGPQGTLFGRNTSAGAISIVTNRPNQENEGRLDLRLGNDGLTYIYGLYNLPVTDKSAVRVSYVSNESDGWLEDAATGKDLNPESNWATKLAWRTSFENGTVLDVSWDHEVVDQLARPAIGVVPMYGPSDTWWTPPAPASDYSDTFLDPKKAPIYNDVVNNNEQRTFDGLTLQLYHSFDWASVTYSASYRSFDTSNRQDEDGTNHINTYLDTENIESNSSFYQELKFNGYAGSVDWVAGISYSTEDATQTSDVNAFTDSINTLYTNTIGFPLFYTMQQALGGAFSGYGLPAVPGITSLGLPWTESMHNQGEFSSGAVFGDAIWHVNDKLNLTFGIRYTKDKKEFSWLTYGREADQLDSTLGFLSSIGWLQGYYQILDTIDPALKTLYTSDVIFRQFSALNGTTVKQKNSWSDVSPRFVADYKINDDIMIWGSYTNGYKAGGYNSVEINSVFENEDVDSFEIGTKIVWPDYRLSMNTSLFYYVYNDKQSIRLDTSNPEEVPQYLVNTSDEEAFGWDLQMQWQATEGLALMFSSQYIDQSYKNYTTPEGIDVSGQPTGLPLWSLAAGGSYTWLFKDASALEFGLMYSFRDGSRCNDSSQSDGTCQVSPNFETGEDQNRVDARLQWSSPTDSWNISAYVQNALDEQYIGGVGGLTADLFGTAHTSLTPPRTYGLEVGFKF
jgi:iron complex outermembrane receptor protein